MRRVWFVTGATRGMGAEIAKVALAAGEQVVATGRKKDAVIHALGNAENLLPLALDVTDENQIKVAVKTAIDRFGRIDVLVNNAGYGHLGVFEESTMEEIQAQYDTNVFGLMAMTHEVIPYMRKQRSGRILNISSVAGLKGVFGGSIYNSSKFAVEGFSQAIAEEFAHFNVKVTAVSPGFFRTDFLDTSSAKYTDQGITEYAKPLAEFREFHDNRNHQQAGDPVKLAQVILKLSQIENPPVSFIAGSDGLTWADTVVKNQIEQIELWKDLSVSTDGTWD
ncbi:short-chain dehydrogenase [Paenibacillus sp. VT-400]|uniref:oxidoreductase n=1 Tax=Paenibacillus sp. VT-400 TaxID=1495853 RepID=UPI00064B7A23|nr:oxidoreductase [Paenibacillus sp. VT-400]KLU54982.1 short-chain dehydrogenase [Paenibacillus sp. VT-400]